MNKNLFSELIKVANVLDEMGIVKEANNLDKIARKIVVSYNPTVHNYGSDDLKKISQISGIYSKDIANYKSIIWSAYHDEKGNFIKSPYPDALQLASNLYNSVVNAWFRNPYTSEQRRVFKLQADNIRNTISGNFDDSNNEIYKGKSLNDILVGAGIVDYYGKLKSNIKSKHILRQYWFAMLKNNFPKVQNGSFEARNLSNTFNMLAMKLPENEPASEESLDI